MAVQSDTSSISYTGNNSTSTSYSVPFVFQENSHLAAIAKVTATGVESAVTLTNHTGAGDPNGGTVRTAVAVPATSTLTIFRAVPATQTTTYQEGGDFPASSHEQALDKLTFIAQQNERIAKRSIRVTEADGARNEIAAIPNTIVGLDANKQPKAMTLSEVKTFLALSGVTLDVDAGMKTFADAGERAAAVPDFTGQLGTQRNTADIYISTGTAAGNWSLVEENMSLDDFAAGFFTADATGRGKFAAGFVDSGLLEDGAVITSKLDDAAVTTSKLDDAAVTFEKLQAPQYTGWRNRLINGNFRVAQRGTSFTSGSNNDDTYNLDRWYVLSDGNDAVDITQTTTEIPTNGFAAIALDVETENKKFGIAQIVEQLNCIGAIGGNVTLSFKAKVSTTTKLDNIKAAIVAWSGTADTVTSDIVSAWGAEGTNPTLIANATYENTPANLNVTTSYATYTVTANVDTVGAKNIIVFIWSDVTDTTAGDFLYITDVQLESGATATPFEIRSFGAELSLCQRYYFKTFGINTAPVQNVGSINGAATTGAAAPPSFTTFSLPFAVAMRSTPATVTTFNPNAANVQARDNTSGQDCTQTTVTATSDRGTTIRAVGPSSAANLLAVHVTADAEL